MPVRSLSGLRKWRLSPRCLLDSGWRRARPLFYPSPARHSPRCDKSHRKGLGSSGTFSAMRGPEQGMWAQEDAMSETTTMKTVRDVALENPGAARVFEKLGIDYCCGGGKSLQEACRDSRLDFDDVCRALQAAEQ